MKAVVRTLLVNVSAAVATAAIVAGAGVVLSSTSRNALAQQASEQQRIDTARIEQRLDRIESLLLKGR